MIYIASWILMFTGPTFFPASYLAYSLIVIIYFIIKISMMLGTLLMINIKTIDIFDRVNNS